MHMEPLATDSDREAALDILLLLADARASARQYRRALDLLTEAELAGGRLPLEYEVKRLAWLGRR